MSHPSPTEAARSRASPPEPVTHEVEIEVRYAETDQMGIVHHRNYLVWYELARTGLCAETGFPYHEIEKLGVMLVVTRTETRYLAPAHYGDRVRVSCKLEKLQSRGLRFSYEVHLAAGQREPGLVLAAGATDHIWVDSEHRRPCRLPEVLRQPFRRAAGLE
ncbi:MAG: acyl-CoA thioesterase [Holophagales bacterium]|nr:acyl-CoA thioesterase [Holophagales bacterium]